MPVLNSIRRVLLTLVACLAVASISITPALGTPAQTAKHRKAKHHKKSPKKKSRCSNPRGDSDHDGIEPGGGNDRDGCGV